MHVMRLIIPKPSRLPKGFLIKALLFQFFIACSLTLFATPFAFIVKGKVVDEGGNALSGVTVVEKGHRNATTTAEDGSFSINIRGEQAVLLISHVGFLPKEVQVKEGSADIVQPQEVRYFIGTPAGTSKYNSRKIKRYCSCTGIQAMYLCTRS